jgi:hypothetical protein
MLETIFQDALKGITLVEEEIGATNKILSRQIAMSARAASMSVCFVTLEEDAIPLEQERTIRSTVDGTQDLTGVNDIAPQRRRAVNAEAMLAALEYDMVVINSFSSYFVDKTERDAIKLIREIEMLSQQGRTFVINYEPGILSDRATTYLHAVANNVIMIQTHIIGDRVDRLLYVPKVIAGEPPDRLIKITVDGAGVQEDTREFVG